MQLIIFDTEFTAWEGSQQRQWSEPWEYREIIQLAAIEVRIEDNQAVTINKSFNEIIKPVRNPQLSDYIISLTGISQSMVDDMGVDFPSALSLFYQFCSEGTIPCFAWGSDAEVLQHNADLYGLRTPDFSRGLLNLNEMIRNKGMAEANLCSGELARHLGLDLTGHNHNALYDVRSIALALEFWLKNRLLSVADFQF